MSGADAGNLQRSPPAYGGLSSATLGSRLLVQAFGAAEWTLTYIEDHS